MFFLTEYPWEEGIRTARCLSDYANGSIFSPCHVILRRLDTVFDTVFLIQKLPENYHATDLRKIIRSRDRKHQCQYHFAIYLKSNVQNFFILVYFVCHTPQFKTLVLAFQSEIWIVHIFNFTVLSWKYRFSENVNYTKVESKANN